MFHIIAHIVLVIVNGAPFQGFRHCIREHIHYTGTVGHPGYWRWVRICH